MLRPRIIAATLCALTVAMSLLSLQVPQLISAAWITLALLAALLLAESARPLGARAVSLSVEEEGECALDELVKAVKEAKDDVELEKMIFE
ncbi:MAG: hypothetical protein QXT50_00630 [Thermofilum sp.]|uniref:Uncharacterized protein n=1 Tax=Thermofilum pendens TaxID=2269 RepID=A0A7C4D1I6_THEPE